jgi:hypothetical protein
MLMQMWGVFFFISFNIIIHISREIKHVYCTGKKWFLKLNNWKLQILTQTTSKSIFLYKSREKYWTAEIPKYRSTVVQVQVGRWESQIKETYVIVMANDVVPLAKEESVLQSWNRKWLNKIMVMRSAKWDLNNQVTR